MASFGQTSRQRLVGVHPALAKIAFDVVEVFDIAVLPNGGLRTDAQQADLVASGKSKTFNSRHLIQEDGYGHAIDCAPYPIDWNDRERFYYMAGLFQMAAKKYGVKIRWGGNWDSDGDFNDQSFDDLPHIEISTEDNG